MNVHPPGTIGVLSGELARYSDFTVALIHTMTPPDSRIVWTKGVDIVGNMNTMHRSMRGEWLWILGDDHVWNPDLLIRLLDRDVDVVVPLCLKRLPPFDPVVYSHQNEEGLYVGKTDMPADGIHQVWAAGSAGMLIRRHVLDALEQPVFAAEGGLNEDLVLCRKIREAGFTIWVDVDQQLGHIGNLTVWPQHKDGEWQIGLELGNGERVTLKRILKTEAEHRGEFQAV